MTDVMTHRGPDDRGVVQRPGIAIGARRLSIIDLSGGHQPMSNETGTVWAAQNGELYNHNDLRTDLQKRGHAFRTRCDTEVLPHLYEQYGDEFPTHLRGMFGAVVWDDEAGRAVLVRDRLGIKPLYYAHVSDLVVFGSELKAVMQSGLVDAALDYAAIDAYLDFGFFPGPLTPLKAVRKLRPGHRLVVDSRGVREERYWLYPNIEPESTDRSVDWWAGELLERLDEAVRIRLMSDVPMGAMLSGGLDSSLIVALMARHSSGSVETFSVGFSGNNEHSELADAREVAQRLGTSHHELEISLDRKADLAELVWHLDEPIADLSALGFLELSRLARQRVTVALSGQGADELMGGYRKHRAAAIARYWHRALGAKLGSALARQATGLPGRAGRLARVLAASTPGERLLASSGNMSGRLRGRLLRGPLADSSSRQALAAAAALGTPPDDPLAAALFLDGQLGLVDDMLRYFDGASMAHSLEVRVPFLDHPLVEFCARIPSAYRVGPKLTSKYVLKRAARGLVPDRIIDKPKIGFFNRAVDAWLQAQISGPIQDYLRSPTMRSAEFIDQRQLELLIREKAGAANAQGSYALLEILILEIWLNSYLPRAMAPRDVTP
jgi:asparagine synthase (glutamine-hydrolysing)